MRVLVALFGIAAGVWLWLGSGWRWDVTPKELVEGKPPIGLRSWVGRYVRLRSTEPSLELATVPEAHNTTCLSRVGGSDGRTGSVWVRYSVAGGPVLFDPRSSFSGRMVGTGAHGATGGLILDTTRGRMNSTSIIALLIAVWGSVLICSNIALWLRQSRVPTATAAKPPARPPAAGADGR